MNKCRMETTSFNVEYLIDNREKFVVEAARVTDNRVEDLVTMIEAELTPQFRERYHLYIFDKVWREYNETK